MMDALGVLYGQENMATIVCDYFPFLFLISPSLQVKSSLHHVVVMHDSFVFLVVPFALVCSNGSGSKVPFFISLSMFCFGYFLVALRAFMFPKQHQHSLECESKEAN
jgi:hypothetical protein